MPRSPTPWRDTHVASDRSRGREAGDLSRLRDDWPRSRPDELAAALGLSSDAVHAALRELAQARHVVLDEDGVLVMAHPFAAIPLGFAVMGKAGLWWGGCAWDSFSLPHLLPDEPEVLVSTTCPGCGRALAWVVGRDGAPGGGEVAHFLDTRLAHLGRRRELLPEPAAVLRSRLRERLVGPSRGIRSATSWTSRRSGGSPGAGTRGGSTADMPAESPMSRASTSEASASKGPSGACEPDATRA